MPRSSAFSPDGLCLAAGDADGLLHLWEARGAAAWPYWGSDGEKRRRLQVHGGAIEALAFRPDSALLATGSTDFSIRLIDPVSGRTVRHLKGHEDVVRSLSFSPDGRLLASGSLDGTFSIWAVDSGSEIARMDPEDKDFAVYAVLFSKDGSELWTSIRKAWQPVPWSMDLLLQPREGILRRVEEITGLELEEMTVRTAPNARLVRD